MERQVIEIHDADGFFKAIYAIADSLHFVGSSISETAGFSLRDEIAMRAIQSMLAQPSQAGNTPSFMAKYAYELADATLKARGVKPNR